MTRSIKMLDGVTATTTSSSVPVQNAGRLSLMVKASGVSSGNGVFTVEVSNDPEVGWVAYNRLVSNVTNTNGQTDTRVANITLSSNTTAIVFFPPGDTFTYLRTTVTRTTDGTYSAVVFVD